MPIDGIHPSRTALVRSDGADISYSVAGHGAAVVCIQGVGVIGNGWRPQVEGLAGHFQVITFDNRGLGRSTSGPGTPTIDAMASDVIAIMDAEGVAAAHVVGHSMGGLIALNLSLAHPKRVKSLALLCTFANGADPTRVSWRMATLGIRTRVGTRAMRRNGMLRMILPPEYLAQVDSARLAREFQELFGRDLADQPPIVSAQLRAMGKYSAADRLGELADVPTLVASGGQDPIAPPRLGRAIAEGIPGAQFVEFAHASHALPIQCPDEVNALLLAHLTRTSGNPARVQL